MLTAEQKTVTFDSTIIEMQKVLEQQQKAFMQEGPVSAKTRVDRIDRIINLLIEHQHSLCDAMSADFGHRSQHQSLMADFYGTLEPLKYAKKHLPAWMKAQSRKVMFPLNLFGAKARVEFQPVGVIGNISTWNFPTHVPFGPAAGIFSAGNRSMVKLSEVTPETSDLIKNLIAQYFNDDEFYAVTGGPEVGAAFAALPFDHILFTGATSIGRHILHAAADNLTPVTLELGGKSPVIISNQTDLKKSAIKLMAGKALNVGQVCLSPDYVFVPDNLMEEFLNLCEEHVKLMFPSMKDNPDYSSVINPRHHQRLLSYIEDAKQKGADVRAINPANEDFGDQTSTQKIPLTFIVNPSDDLIVMQEEIFGPLICFKPYKDVKECVRYINSKPRPLALYYFGNDKQEERYILDHTISGGVTINDVMGHVSCEDLPFGGIGASGMGAYHGFEGFKTFSHQRSVYTQTKLNMMELAGMMPPYSKKTDDQLKRMIKK